MARKKQYSEEEVIEKATNLFWKNGFEATSMQMLEKEMGINKFSIYASFGNKDGVFMECLKNYSKKINIIQNKLKNSNNGLAGVKQYFYDFIEFSKDLEAQKGCFVTNTFGEVSDTTNPSIVEELKFFVKDIKGLIEINVKQENRGDEFTETKSDYLMVALHGLASASKVFDHQQLKNYIENIFRDV